MSAAQASRRAVIAAAGAAGLTTALTACGDSGGSDGGYGSGGTDQDGTQEEGSGEPDEGGGGGAELAQTSEIPEGAGKVFRDEKVVVVQPASGEFKAYSAECTHKGCLVSGVEDGTINCTCHQSKFRISDGSVAGGPAREPLPEARITVEGDRISLD